ncbi:MAG: hypothetical protein M2R45_03586 [Verrucomicrobia subdivision 3 bacterium]|nr:hypothetical protein [Limisphaerales bacterium]MCS1414781.1 hypothetical protein [Limisphaerales bacterium]
MNCSPGDSEPRLGIRSLSSFSRLWIVVGGHGLILSSPNRLRWRQGDSAGRWAVVGEQEFIISRQDDEAWLSIHRAEPEAVMDTCYLRRSSNGIDWFHQDLGPYFYVLALGYNQKSLGRRLTFDSRPFASVQISGQQPITEELGSPAEMMGWSTVRKTDFTRPGSKEHGLTDNGTASLGATEPKLIAGNPWLLRTGDDPIRG